MKDLPISNHIMYLLYNYYIYKDYGYIKNSEGIMRLLVRVKILKLKYKL